MNHVERRLGIGIQESFGSADGFRRVPFKLIGKQPPVVLFDVVYLLLLCGAPEVFVAKQFVVAVVLDALADHEILPESTNIAADSKRRNR